MVDVVVGEIDPPLEGGDWKPAMRERVLSARRALLPHPWASRVIETDEPDPDGKSWTVWERRDGRLRLSLKSALEKKPRMMFRRRF